MPRVIYDESMHEKHTHEELTHEFVERCYAVDKALEETKEGLENLEELAQGMNQAVRERLKKLEESNKLLRSFAAFGAGFLAARIAIGVTRLIFGLDKRESN